MYKINNKKTSELSKRVLVFGLIGVTAFGLLASTLLSGCGKNENITDNSSAMTEKDYQKLSEQKKLLRLMEQSRGLTIRLTITLSQCTKVIN